MYSYNFTFGGGWWLLCKGGVIGDRHEYGHLIFICSLGTHGLGAQCVYY